MASPPTAGSGVARLHTLIAELRLPVVAAPMTRISGPELVAAACAAGIIGSMPAHNASTTAELDSMLTGLLSGLGDAGRLLMPNLVVHRANSRIDADLECCADHQVSAVITSVGAPDSVVRSLHRAGIAVLADVASVAHAERAVRAGVDGLVLLTAGAGGQTGAANPFAFVREVRLRFDGVIALAGGIGDGRSILAAQVAGADLAYLGTRFLATDKSRADERYRQAVLEAGLDDVRLTSRISGIPSSILQSWLDQHEPDPAITTAGFDFGSLTDAGPFAWSAGHAVSAIRQTDSVADVVAALDAEYRSAVDDTLARWRPTPTPHTTSGKE